MKLEDITDQSALDELIKSSVDDAIGGLVNKNNELLGKLKKAKGSDEEIESLRKAAEELKALKEGQLEEQGEYKKLLEKTREQHETETEKLRQALQAEQQTTKTLLVHDGLSRELSKHNVNPVLLDAAVQLLAPEVSVVDAEGKRIAQVGEKTLDLYVADWVSSDVGKNFALASANSGGGAGGNGDGTKVNEAEKHFKPETWNLTEQGRLAQSDPDAYKALHEKYPTRNAGARSSAA
jgi:hypothetical protein